MITIRRLRSGYYHIRGLGPCNWSQPPDLTASSISEYAFPEASREFIIAIARIAARIRSEADTPGETAPP